LLYLRIITAGNLLISDCNFYKARYDAIHLESPDDVPEEFTAGNTIIIENSGFENSGIGNEYLSWGNHGSAGMDINIDSLYCGNLIIRNCTMTGSRGHGSIFIVSNDTNGLPPKIRNLLIEHNTIHDVVFRGISTWTATNAEGYIRNNEIYNCGTINEYSSGVACNGIFSPETKNIVAEGNEIYNVYENGIEGVFKAVRHNVIRNTGIKTDTHPTPSTEGIYAAAHEITGNKIYNVESHGIAFAVTPDEYTGEVPVPQGYAMRVEDNEIINDPAVRKGQTAFNFGNTHPTIGYRVYLKNNTIKGFDQSVNLWGDGATVELIWE
jgi:hypothetical protein